MSQLSEPTHSIAAPPPVAFVVRGPKPRSPLALRLLHATERAAAGPDGALQATLIDCADAGPEVVREALAHERGRPLVLIAAGRAHRDALAAPIRFSDASDALLVLPTEPPAMVDFSGTPDPVMTIPERAPGPDGLPGREPRTVRFGEHPPPEPEPPVVDPARFANPHAADDAVAGSVLRELDRFRRGEVFPPRTAESPCPEGVLVFAYPAITKVVSVSLNDPFYRNEYTHGKNQEGELAATYHFTGYANLDANGDFQSYMLVMEIAASTTTALDQELVTQTEKFDPDRYLGWVQERVIVGVDYKIADEIRLLGVTPTTINKKVTQATTRGFSIDIGFKKGASTPKVGLNFKNEISTTTTFDDWMVGELSGPVVRPRADQDRTPLDESAKWQYAVAFPWNGLFPDDLVTTLPPTKDFTPQTTGGFNFRAAAAFELPADTRGARDRKVTFDADLVWHLKYYYRGTAFFQPQEKPFRRGLDQGREITIELGLIPGGPR